MFKADIDLSDRILTDLFGKIWRQEKILIDQNQPIFSRFPGHNNIFDFFDTLYPSVDFQKKVIFVDKRPFLYFCTYFKVKGIHGNVSFMQF